MGWNHRTSEVHGAAQRAFSTSAVTLQHRSLALPFTVLEWTLPAVPRPSQSGASKQSVASSQDQTADGAATDSNGAQEDFTESFAFAQLMFLAISIDAATNNYFYEKFRPTLTTTVLPLERCPSPLRCCNNVSTTLFVTLFPACGLVLLQPSNRHHLLYAFCKLRY
ncbi:hypothetical protein Hanom_Chr09g00825021 [Helianthus anomalus]